MIIIAKKKIFKKHSAKNAETCVAAPSVSVGLCLFPEVEVGPKLW